MHVPDANTRSATSASILPPDGALIRVTESRRKILWVGAAGFGFVGFSVIISAIQVERPIAILPALVAGGLIVVSFRLPLSGVILERTGLKGRNLWWTYRWRWYEIERFELRQRGDTPRFQVHTRDGKVRGFLGFFSRTPEEERRAEELFQALQHRLREEQGQRYDGSMPD